LESDWRKVIARYNHPDLERSVGQLASTLLLYLAAWYSMYRSLELSYALTLALSVPAGGLLVRLFIIVHDCGHGSFFRSRKACDAVGIVLGLLVCTPYFSWTRKHAAHHTTVGDLDRRGQGDVWTLTVEEYRRSPVWRRLWYRLYRSPFLMFGVGSFLFFLVFQRFAFRFGDRRHVLSVFATDLALAGLAALLGAAIGIRAVILIQLPILFVAAAGGVWLFYVQHQFAGVSWVRHAQWDYRTVALEGSSFYRLPAVLRWFSGNIGFHHIHHLSPRIPNYKLAACHCENALFRTATTLRLRDSLASLRLRLWDESARRLIGFRQVGAVSGR